MGIWDKLKHEFIDIIEWLDDSQDTMVWRFPRYQNEIKMGAKLTVRESQVAVFINEGQVADVFKPGMYELSTQNLPLLATIMGWKYGFNSPFKAEVYFLNTKNFTDKKWGTKNPIMMRDPEFGPIRLRAFGSYAIKIKDPVAFIREIAGTDGNFTTEQITEQLRNLILTRFTDALGESNVPILDLASNYNEMSEFLQTRINPDFNEYGLDLTKFLIENISLPPEVEEALDKRSSMGIIGNLNNYSQFQAANAMEKAAENPGGNASAGIGMGMGFAMANQMGQSMFQQQPAQQQTAAPAPPPLPQQLQVFMAVNGQQQGPFDENTLKQMIQQGNFKKDSLVWMQGMAGWLPASQVPELTKIFGAVPPPLPPTPPQP